MNFENNANLYENYCANYMYLHVSTLIKYNYMCAVCMLL